MDIIVSQAKGAHRPVTVFTISGPIESSNYMDFEQKARDAHAAGTRDLLLDLKGVDYVSSAAIRSLNVIIKLLQTDAPEESDAAIGQGLRDGTWKSPHLKLVHVTLHVAEPLKISGMDMLLEEYTDLEKALASF
jgi:STAS domain